MSRTPRLITPADRHRPIRLSDMPNRFLVLLLAVVACLFGTSVLFGRDAVELRSRYLGDGLFEYRLRTLEDHLFSEIKFSQLVPGPFTGYVSNTLPPHWTNGLYKGHWNGIHYDESLPQPRINEITFSVQTSSTHFRREPYGFGTILSVHFDPQYFGGESEGGYLNLDCLVPCAPEESDGSATVLVSRHEFVPDIVIDGLVFTNGHVHGLTFSWPVTSTVELQASHDLVAWTPVARFPGQSGQTTWTTNSPLEGFGRTFRLLLIDTRTWSLARSSALRSITAQRLLGTAPETSLPSQPTPASPP